VRTTLTLDNVIYSAAQEAAKQTGRTLGEVISEWAKRGIYNSLGTSSSKSSQFPVFNVAPGSSPITTEKVQRIINDEGLPP
jgi:hypothetical protein